MKQNEPFSIRKRRKSLRYAMDGIQVFFKQEHNARIHLVATIAVVILVIILRVTNVEAILLFLTIGLVWLTEIINTAIEKVADFVSPQKDNRIKYIKDLSAAAVLVAAITALATGCIIFIPKL